MVASSVNARLFVKARADGHVGFHADDGFDAGRGAFFVKFQRAVEVAVVGEAEGGRAVLLGLLYQIRNFHQTIQERVVTVVVEVYEGHAASIAEPTIPADVIILSRSWKDYYNPILFILKVGQMLCVAIGHSQ